VDRSESEAQYFQIINHSYYNKNNYHPPKQTGALEAANMRKYGRLVSLSEQNMIDCTGDYSNAGCNGGWPVNAFAYAVDNTKVGSTSTLREYGVDTEADYVYVAQVGFE
jgi:cathepsin L